MNVETSKKGAGSGFPGKKGQDGGINRKKWERKQDLRTLLWTLKSTDYPGVKHQKIVATDKSLK